MLTRSNQLLVPLHKRPQKNPPFPSQHAVPNVPHKQCSEYCRITWSWNTQHRSFRNQIQHQMGNTFASSSCPNSRFPLHPVLPAASCVWSVYCVCALHPCCLSRNPLNVSSEQSKRQGEPGWPAEFRWVLLALPLPGRCVCVCLSVKPRVYVCVCVCVCLPAHLPSLLTHTHTWC